MIIRAALRKQANQLHNNHAVDDKDYYAVRDLRDKVSSYLKEAFPIKTNRISPH